MNRTQAEWIQEHYQGVPANRGDQEELIRRVYPSGTLQRRPLYECGDAQVFRVAERLFLEAMESEPQPAVPQPARPAHRYDADHLARARREWEEHLYEMFNSSPDKPDYGSPSDMEGILLS